MRTYYIYKATNKINKKSYIGQTVDFRSRVWQHMRCYEKEDCLFHKAIEEYGYENFEWQVLESCCDKSRAIELEKHYIELYDTYRNGYNENKGGVGGHNARAVVEISKNGDFVRRYDSAADAEKEGFNNVSVLLCCKNKLRSCKGFVFMFEDEYLKNGARVYQKPKSTRCRRIIQCNSNGELIQKFESIKEASKLTGANRTAILGVLSKRYKLANGFIFVYEEEFPIKDLSVYKKEKKGKKVAQVDIETEEIIKVFDRISDAGKELNVNYKAIHKVVDKEGRTAYGYKWISQ